MGHTCNKSSPNRMRSSEGRRGNITKPSVNQPEFGRVDDSLSEGFAYKSAIAVFIRAGRSRGSNGVIEVKRGVSSRPRGDHAVPPFWSRYLHRIGYVTY